MTSRRLSTYYFGWTLCVLIVATAWAMRPAQAAAARLIYPVDGAQNIDTRLPFRWNAVSGAQAYRLQIGSQPPHLADAGDSTVLDPDLYDSGAIGGASVLVPAMPANQTLYTRLGTQTSGSGVWTYNDSTFQAVARSATFSYPPDGATNVDPNNRFTWNAIAGSGGYTVRIGTTPGGSDLYSSGTLAADRTWCLVNRTLPLGQTLYARLSTKLNDRWWSTDISFQVGGRPAAFTYPVNGYLKFDPRQPFSWTAAPGAQNYYLRIGTTVGAQDVVNSNSLAPTATTYTTNKVLPAGQTLFGRISTRLNNSWWHSDITFQAIPRPAAFIYPTNNSSKVDSRLPFTWTAVTGAQAYYFKIGTAVGAQDVVNSGQLGAGVTSCTLRNPLPAGQTLYARISTKLSNAWWYTDISFQAIAPPATFTFPLNGVVQVDWRQPFTWVAVPGATGYYVKIGTAPGAQDLVNSAVLASGVTSYALRQPLPAGPTLYARLSTQFAGSWWYNDITFKAAQSPATFICPTKSQKVDIATIPFSWHAVPQAQAYMLSIGSTQGTDNLLSSGEITSTSYWVPPLPVGPILWARLSTKDTNGNWDYIDVTFLAQGVPLVFMAPTHGSTNVDFTPTMAWSTAPLINGTAPTYRLMIGSSPGKSDILHTTDLTATNYTVQTPLPVGSVLYARVAATLGDRSQRFGDTVFLTMGGSEMVTTLLYPAEGDMQPAVPIDLDASRPFAWSTPEVAAVWQLQVYSGVGGVDESGRVSVDGLALARDSGLLHAPRVFFSDLPLGAHTGRLGTLFADGWHWRTFTFNVTHTGSDAAQLVESGLWAANYLRCMADEDNNPFNWSILPKYMAHWPRATCVDYRDTLLVVLKEMRLTQQFSVELQPRRLNIGFHTYDVHALCEIYNVADGRWVLIDPTFALAVTRTADGTYATREDIQAATQQQRWGDITYAPLGNFGTGIARRYYLDYPLLFLNLTVPPRGAGNTVLPYLERRAFPITNPGVYCLQAPVSPATVLFNGEPRSYETLAIDATSILLFPETLSVPPDNNATVSVFSPRRYVF